MLRFYNTLTRQIEAFVPQREGRVRMYNCGPTVYSSPHIGNFRSFLLADLLRRYLDWRGYQVSQVMNLTDVGHLTNDEEESGEDKMEAGARREKKTVWELAEQYIAEFFAATAWLSIRPAQHYPRATDHIPEMLAIIGTLIDAGLAYVTEAGNVYFEVERFPTYGALSGNRGEDLLAGARIEVNPEKRDPRDFALWKVDHKHQMQWDSPWGRGYPGWHIECSAMARKYLGDTLDIHTGGEDNIFPHHECEIAQSEGSMPVPFVRYWLHARHLLVDGRKMAKRDGNFFTVNDIKARGYSGDALRLTLMKTHYRESLNFTEAALGESARKVERYADLSRRLAATASVGTPSSTLVDELAGARARFQAALDDDLNISVGIAELDALVGAANRADPRGVDAAAWSATLRSVLDVFGLLEQQADPAAEAIDPQIERLLEQRLAARAARNWAESDRIRDQIKALGYDIIDTKDGLRVTRRKD